MYGRRVIVALTMAAALAWAQGLSAQTTVTVGEGATVTLESGNGETSLKVENNAILDVKGRLRLQGTDGNVKSRVDGITAGTDKYTVIIENGGELDANYFHFDQLARGGIRVRSGGRILQLNNGTFDNQVDEGGVYLNLADMNAEWVDTFNALADADPAVAIANWTLAYDDGNGLNTVAVVSTFTTEGRGKVIKLTDNDSGTAPVPDNASISRTFGGASGYARGYVEFKVRFGSTAEYGKVNLYNAAGTLFYTLKFGEDLNPNTVRGTLSGAADDVYLPSGSYSANRWYKVRVTWNVSAVGASSDKWNVWIDGVHKGTLNYTSATDCANIAKVEFATDEATTVNTNMFIDDVSIVPLTASDPIAIVFEDTVTDSGGNPAGWTVSEPAGTAVTVPTASGEGIADSNPNTGSGNVIKMADTDDAAICSITRQIASSTSVDLRKGFLEFKVRKTNATTALSAKMTDTGVGTFTLKLDGSGNVTGNGTSSQTYQTYAANTWYKVRIEWDLRGAATADYWSVWIDDVLKQTSPWSAGTTDFTGIDTVSFETDATAQPTAYLDDIRVGELDTIDGSARDHVAYSFNGVSFVNSGGRASIYNVKASASTPVVWFLGGTGGAWGATYESDPYNRIRWSGTDANVIIGRYNQAGAFQAAYATIGEAIAASTAGQRIKVNRNIAMGEAVKLTQDDASTDVALEGGVFIPMGGKYVSGTYTPDRAASGYQETLASLPIAYDSSAAGTNHETPVRTGVTSTTPYSTSQGMFSKAVVFRGTDDVISIPDDDATLDFDLITLDFTVEAWVQTTASSVGDIVTKRMNDASDGYAVKFNADGTVSGIVDGALGSVTATTVVTINDGKWHHVALVVDRNGAGDIVSAKVYIDGTERATGSQAGADTLANAANLGIGANPNSSANFFIGKIDEVRISNNLRYTAAFTPSTSAFADGANTMALFHFEGSILKDTSGNGLNGYLSNTTTQNPAGTASGKFGNDYSFDGGDSVVVDDNNNLDFGDRAGNVDFTVEAWIKTNSPTGDGDLIAKKADAALGSVGYLVKYINASSSVTAYVSDGTTQITVTNATNVNDGGWHHIALTADRNGNAYLYVDGTAGGAQDMNSVVNTISNAQNLIFGSGFKGSIDEARISSTIRHTANFTVTKIQPFTPDASTRALYHFGETYITLRNAVVARGGLNVVIARNCTLFRADATWPTLLVTQSVLKNTILESAQTTTGTVIEAATCVTTWTNGANSLNNIAMLDYHLKAAGVAAIDLAERLDNIVYDATVDPIDMDSVARTAPWDIGADEFAGADTKLATMGGTEIGNILRVFPAGTRNSVAISYAVTAGGSTNAESYDNRLIVLRNSDFSVLGASVPAPGPIVNMTYFRATTTPFLVYIYVVVDTDNDGLGDSIMAFKDTGNSTIAVDTAFDTDTIDDGVQYWGSPIKTIASWRIAAEGDALSSSASTDPRYGRKLYFVAGQKLCKVNADPGDANDDDPGDQKYGELIWRSSARTFSANGTLNIDTVNNVYVSVTADASTDVAVKLAYTGDTTVIGNPDGSAPAVSASWKIPAAAEAGVDQNENGQIIYAYEANTRILIAPSDGKRIYTTATNVASDTYYWASEADTAGGNLFSVVVDSLPFRYFGRYHVLVGAGEKVYKIKDTGSAADDPADWKEPGGQAGNKNGAVVDSDWPIDIKGSITSRAVIWGNKIYFGTKEGYCYAVTFEGRSQATSDDGTSVSGFPYLIPNQRVTDVFILSDGVYFVTDQGMSIKVPLQ